MTFDLGVHGGQRLLARQITPEDTDALLDFAQRSTAEDLRLRFFSRIRPVHGPLVERLTHIDPETAIALVAVDPASEAGCKEILGVVRLNHEKGAATGELAVMVRSDLKHRGIGHELITLILKLAAERGITRVVGDVLAENRAMLRLVRDLGGRPEARGPEPGIVRVAFETAGLRGSGSTP
jgi:acetyltransferase